MAELHFHSNKTFSGTLKEKLNSKIAVLKMRTKYEYSFLVHTLQRYIIHPNALSFNQLIFKSLHNDFAFIKIITIGRTFCIVNF